MEQPDPVHNSRIDLRISNPEKDQWASFAKSRGMTLTEVIKQVMRQKIADEAGNIPPISTFGSFGV